MRPDQLRVAESPKEKSVRCRFIALTQKKFETAGAFHGRQGSRVLLFFRSTILRPWFPASKPLPHPVWLL